MKNVSVSNEKNKSSVRFKILSAALTLVIIVGLGAAAQAASEDKEAGKQTDKLLRLYRQVQLFNPFTLTVLSTADTMSESSVSPMTSGGGGGPKRPPIRIPFKPVPRSPWQPPWPWPPWPWPY